MSSDLAATHTSKSGSATAKDVTPVILVTLRNGCVYGNVNHSRKSFPRSCYYARRIFSFSLVLAELFIARDKFLWECKTPEWCNSRCTKLWIEIGQGAFTAHGIADCRNCPNTPAGRRFLPKLEHVACFFVSCAFCNAPVRFLTGDIAWVWLAKIGNL